MDARSGSCEEAAGATLTPLSAPDREQPPVGQIAVLIPAYNPDLALADFVRSLSASGFGAVIVIDDGSDAACQVPFGEISGLPGCVLVRHESNFGKGRALKTGLKEFLLRYPNFVGVITADADGQHTVEGVLDAARQLSSGTAKLILGCRSFEGDVPFRSRLGNVLTKWIFGFMTGRLVRDTQSGLRAIPTALAPKVLKVEGERYEYEMNMLVDAAISSGIAEFPIKTVFLRGNLSSHFHPIRDSARIYIVLARFACSSLISAGLDFAVFSIAFWTTGSLAIAVTTGRLASLVNFYLNRRLVFRASNDGLGAALTRYYALTALLAFASYLGIRFLSSRAGVPVLAAKVVVDTTLWFVNFSFQRAFVFRGESVEPDS